MCRFDNEVLHRVKSSKSQLRREPFEGTHRKVVVISLSDSELRCEISEGIELVGSVEFLIVFAVTALNFAVMPGRIRTEEFMSNTEFRKRFLKERWGVALDVNSTLTQASSARCLFIIYIYTGSAGKLGIAKRCAR